MSARSRGPRAETPRADATNRGTWLAAFVVAGITCLVFLPALNNGFVSWDDDKNFLTNPYYRGLGPDQLRWMWTTFHLGTWIPLSWMTLGLDYTLWGMDPAGYHATNVLLHTANAVVLFFVARRILRVALPGTPADSFGSLAAAAFAALVFSVHPLRVESVAWITERRDVLSGLLYFSSLLCYLRAVQDSRRGPYFASIGFFALALLAKGTAVTLPVLLLILNVWPLRRLGGSAGWPRRVYGELIPFVVLAGIVTTVVFIALQPLEQLSLPGKIAVSAYSLQFYLWKTLVPLGLSPLYAMPAVVDPARAVFLLSIVVVVLGAILAWAVRRRAPGVSVALLAFAAILFPLLGVHQGGPQIAADRITYNASIALALLAGGLLHEAWKRAPRLAMAGGLVMLATLATLTVRQIGVWRDSASLWSRVLAVEPDSPYGHNSFGNVAMRLDRVDDAVKHYQLAIRFRPGYAEAHMNLGVALTAQGRLGDAIAEYRRALELDPRNDETENNWGVALARSGDSEGAIPHFVAATAANPSNADAHVNWGNALVRLGKLDEAIAHYRDAVTWRPDHADAHHNWGVALAQQGKLAEAAARFENALAADPRHAEAREYLTRARQLMNPDSAAARRKSP